MTLSQRAPKARTVRRLAAVALLAGAGAAGAQQDAPPGVGRETGQGAGLDTGRTAGRAVGSPEAPSAACGPLPSHAVLTEALRAVVAPGDPSANGGLGNPMWATVVDRSGVVCAVARSGERMGDQWPGGRAISAAKAYTANAFSLPQFALSTANLYWPSQPRQSLYGLAAGSPVGTRALEGDADRWGTADDPVVGLRLGGVTVFAGGLALYDREGALVGGLGLSGDQSCTDHVIAWKVRDALGLDHVPKGVTDAGTDNIIHDLTVDPGTRQEKSRSGYGHPTCSARAQEIAERLADTHPVGGR